MNMNPPSLQPFGEKPEDRPASPPYGKPVICPYLGLRGFTSLVVAYPSIGNACCRTRPPEPTSFEHQRAFCLGAYQGCPALRAGEDPAA